MANQEAPMTAKNERSEIIQFIANAEKENQCQSNTRQLQLLCLALLSNCEMFIGDWEG